MPEKIEMKNKRFGNLVVIGQKGVDRWGQYLWECLCACGNKTVVSGGNLRRGVTKSCGCWKKEARATHGLGGTPAHRSWAHMKSRCNNPKDKRYKNYGGRGIKVCKRWHIFENFLKDMGERPFGITIERINNNGDYEPTNCRWATMAEQNRNNSRTRLITYKGQTKCISEWARIKKIHKNTLIYRLNNHPPETAFRL